VDAIVVLWCSGFCRCFLCCCGIYSCL
jgi:hypothetical protein